MSDGPKKPLHTEPQPAKDHGSVSDISGASKAYQPGETGTFEVNLGDSHSDKAYDGTKFQLVDSTRAELNNLTPVCSPDTTPPNPPVITTNGGLPHTIEPTDFALEGTTDADYPIAYLMENSKPVTAASAVRDAQGFITVDLTGITDEEDGSTLVLDKLNATAPGLSFVPMPGQPGKFRSTAPSSLTSLNLSVAGLNQSLTDDENVVVIPPTSAPSEPGKFNK